MLGCEAGTPERELVDATDAALVTLARALCGLARLRTAQRRIEEAESSARSDVNDAGEGSAADTRKVESIPFVERPLFLLGQVEEIADRFWSDLVCTRDYFEPTGGWMVKQKKSRNSPASGEESKAADYRQPGEFVVALNPDLRAGGDFVSRCLCIRVDGLRDTLARFRKQCGQLLPTSSRHLAKRWDEIEKSWVELCESVDQLRQVCLQSADRPLRDACIVLTQVYAAFHSQPDVGWLGLTEDLVQRATAIIRYRFTRTRDVELAERTAVALGQLRSLYIDKDEQQSAVEEAIATGGLVVVSLPPAVYWEGKLINVQWHQHRQGWECLSRLAKKARLRAALEVKDLYEDKVVSESALAMVVNRLKKLLPASLSKHIIPSRSPSGYLLDVEHERLHLFPKSDRHLKPPPAE